MKYLVALALLASCTATVGDAGAYLLPNYLEVGYDFEDGELEASDSAWDRDYDGNTLSFTLGWYLQPVAITTRDRAGVYEPIQAVNPDAEEIVGSLRAITDGMEASAEALAVVAAEAAETQKELIHQQEHLQELNDKTMLDNVGAKEVWSGGVLTSLLGLFLLFKRLGILNGKTSTTDDS